MFPPFFGAALTRRQRGDTKAILCTAFVHPHSVVC
jgi:hypothetical protein